MKRLLALLPVLMLAGGCAAIPMNATKTVDSVPPDKALVTFIRPVIMIGEAIPLYLWDGDHFVGVLGSGSTSVRWNSSPRPRPRPRRSVLVLMSAPSCPAGQSPGPPAGRKPRRLSLGGR